MPSVVLISSVQIFLSICERHAPTQQSFRKALSSTMSTRTSSDASESTLQGQQSEEKVPFIDQEWRPTALPSRERPSLLRRIVPYLALATANLVFLLLISKLLEQRYIHGPNIVYSKSPSLGA
ncbi:hypothetical protein CB0940_10975 [Cercospora beticola]|uniref:Uncharacterized protein n=1 Tax=Cercospora beticola TaxID=122368 RepID=A0A2G5HCX9_CERBT|nr:hypothetical protein CB0940_10975 [Cercospora beticola]PIA90355.1 hypothetical protein CB0940_10975 [Cercospora beticola]